MGVFRGLISAGVRNSVFSNMVMVCILVAGYVSARTLVTETYPEFSLDAIAVDVAYPGAGPEEIEQEVCTKIEEALEGLSGVKRTWSRTSEAGGQVVIELLPSVNDSRTKMLDVKDRVDRITTFPQRAEPPVVSEIIARNRVINVAVYGDVSERTLKETAVEIRNELLRSHAISQVEITATRDYEISIQVSRESLLQYGLTLRDVAGIVAQNTLDAPAGLLRASEEELSLRSVGQRYTAADFEDIVLIAKPDGTLIKLGMVATITDGFEEDFKRGRFQGQPAAMLEVFRTPDQGTGTIATEVRDYIAEKQAELPDGLHLDVWADASQEVDARIDMLVENGLMGMVLVVIVLSLFLDFRVSLYVALGIPVAFAGALAVMYAMDQTLNMITLFGLIMVTGIIVDDAIVIADEYRCQRSRGDAPVLAAINGTNAVALPVLGSSATTIVAFMPLFFVAGIIGKFIAVLPAVVISAIVFSAVEAFCILPCHLRHCRIVDETVDDKPSWRQGLRQRVETTLDRFVNNVHRPICEAALRRRGPVLAVSVAFLLLSVGLVAGGRVPFTVLPEVDGNVVRARVQFLQGVPSARTKEAVEQIETAAKVLNDPNVLKFDGAGKLVRRTFSVVGQWSGWPGQVGSHLCEVMIELAPVEENRPDGRSVLAAWAAQVGRIDDAVSVTFEQTAKGPGAKPIVIRLLGDDLDDLQKAAEETGSALAEFAGVSEIEQELIPGRREVQVRLKPLARTLGVTLDMVAQELRDGFLGGEAVRIQRGRDEVRVQVRYPSEERVGVADIEDMRIRSATGQEIPFSAVAEYDIERSFVSIRHEDGRRQNRVTADVDERRTTAEAILGDFEKTFLEALPEKHPGISYAIGGGHAQMIESLRSMLAGFAVALVAIYALLAGMLRSYVQPLVIMVAIPLGFIGAIVGHLITGHNLTIMSTAGMVALAGVVVNDALVLLSQINDSIRQGKDVHEAVLESSQLRFRAVMLTSITTIAGLGPLLLERSTQAQTVIPMAISLTFGLAFATVLTLVVVPACFLGLNDAIRFVRWLWYGGDYPSAESVVALPEVDQLP